MNAATSSVVKEIPKRVAHIAVTVDDSMIIWGGYNNDKFEFMESYLPTDRIMLYHTELDDGYWTEHKTDGDIPPGTGSASALLLSGKMYIFGGFTKDGNTNELYCLDLQTLTWKLIIPDSELLPSPRDKFSAWSFENKLYYFGGFGVNLMTGRYLKENGQFVRETPYTFSIDIGWNDQLVVFDVESNTWSNPECKGSIPTPRAAHSAVRLKNLVYIFGGCHDQKRMNDLHTLDLETLTWSGELYVEGVCPCGRSLHTFTAISEEVIFLYGGFSTHDVPLSDAWQLNVNDRQWSQVTLPPCHPRLWHTACCLVDDEVLIFGGCENDIHHWNQRPKQSNEVLTIQLNPYRLQRLCLQTVYKYFSSDKWKILPKSLNDQLLKRKHLGNNSTVNSNQPVTNRRDAPGLGSLCALC